LSCGARFVRWTLARGVWLWAIALLAFLPSAWHTARLYGGLRSEFERLLPRSAPSVRALDELQGRLEGLHHLGVVVDVGDPSQIAAGERFLDDLAERVKKYPPRLVRGIRTGQQEERAFLDEHALLYAELGDLKEIRRRVEARRDWEVTRATGTALEDDEAPPELGLDEFKEKYRQRAGMQRFPTGRFSSAEQRTTLLLIEVGREHGAGRELLARVKGDMAALGGPGRYGAGMTAGFAGDVAINVEETEALMADLSLSSLLVLVAVGGVLSLYFRWWKAIPLLLLPLLVATGISFGLAALPPFLVRELNSNTAFLASIIVGNGVNPGIMLLARYVEERRGGATVEAALAVALPGSVAGTSVAALAAASSYGALALTQFEGFRQFGYLGGLGMVVAWALTYLLLPPLLRWVDRGELPPRPSEGALLGPVASVVGRHAPALVVVAVAATAAAGLAVRGFGADDIETDFSRLRRRDTWQRGEGHWGAKMNAMMGEYLTPLVALADSPEGARRAGEALKALAATPEHGSLLARVRTLDDVLPAQQAEKLEEIRLLDRTLTARLRAKLDPEQRSQLERLLSVGERGALTAERLPRTFTVGLRELDGTFGRSVVIFPRPTRELWQGPRLLGFVEALREATSAGAEGGVAPRLAGTLPVSADIVASMKEDGPRVTAGALGGAVLVVLALFRLRAATVLVLGSLLVGVLWMVGAVLGLGVKINFSNFIAFPITFGIGVEYAVNVVNRYEVDRRRDILAAVRSTGAAVALCSATTILGYSSLLVAANQALFLFGLLAVLGEVTCLLAALVAMPALLSLRSPHIGGSAVQQAE
jgi:predicted RND superfamily exporter protein